MNASQYKRIRAKLERGRDLAAQAHQLAVDGHAPPGMRELTARAADDAANAVRDLDQWDASLAMQARSVANALRLEPLREAINLIRGASLNSRDLPHAEAALMGRATVEQLDEIEQALDREVTHYAYQDQGAQLDTMRRARDLVHTLKQEAAS